MAKKKQLKNFEGYPGQVVRWEPNGAVNYGVLLCDRDNYIAVVRVDGVIERARVKVVDPQLPWVADDFDWHVIGPHNRPGDGFAHYGLVSPSGAQAFILAGCREGMPADMLIHWRQRMRSMEGGPVWVSPQRDRRAHHERMDMNRWLNDWSIAFTKRVMTLQVKVARAHATKMRRELARTKRA